jgi:hypothetical protein
LQQVNDLFSQEAQEETFFHELMHWLYYSLGEQELQHNEKHVEQMGALLYQALTTCEYGEDDDADKAREEAA